MIKGFSYGTYLASYKRKNKDHKSIQHDYHAKIIFVEFIMPN